jgi:hypothetical protein
LECALKANLAKLTKPKEFPDRTFADRCWTHYLLQLLGLTALKTDFDAALQADAN